MTLLVDTTYIELEHSDDWLTVWFNQPERRNPLTDDVVKALLQVCEALRDNTSIQGA